MSPLGLGDELRAAQVTLAGCWGYLCLHRADSPHGFTPAEVRLIGRLTPHLGNGCRQSLTVPYRDPSGIAAAAPGVIVLHPDLTVAAITGEAEHWLARIADHRPGPGRLPVAVYAVAAPLQSIDRGTARPGAAPTVRVPSTTGGWLLLHASHLNSSAGGDIAVIIEPVHPGNAAPLLLSAQGLTRRERDVALLVPRRIDPGDRGRTAPIGLHRQRPPEVHLRQDRRPQPPRSGRPRPDRPAGHADPAPGARGAALT
jgi:hypothetical protein